MKRKRKKSKDENQPSFFKEYNFEITVISMFVLGVFLLVEKMEISQTLFSIIKTIIFIFADTIKAIRNGIYDILYWLELSDLVGVVLILLALFMIGIRTRIRLLSKYYKIDKCPECNSGNKLKRVQKKLKHRIIHIVLQLRVYYYQCDSCYKKQLVVLTKRR
tara:strand:+ start:628 stop:1113 length:486 start_codon:yes stop_codon:yes gene_type:complete